MKKIMDWKTASATLVVVASSISLAACGGSSDGGTGSAGGDTVASAGNDTAASAGGDTAASAGGDTAAAGGDTAAPAASGDNQQIIDAMATGIVGAPGSIITDEADAKCWAAGMVDGIGADRLTEVGLSTGEAGLGAAGLTPEEANVMTDSLFSCVDVKAIMGEQFTAQGMTADVSTCVLDKLPEADLKTMVSASILGETPDPAATQSMATAAAECVTG